MSFFKYYIVVNTFRGSMPTLSCDLGFFRSYGHKTHISSISHLFIGFGTGLILHKSNSIHASTKSKYSLLHLSHGTSMPNPSLSLCLCFVPWSFFLAIYLHYIKPYSLFHASTLSFLVIFTLSNHILKSHVLNQI
jgi:hypothetical protein